MMNRRLFLTAGAGALASGCVALPGRRAPTFAAPAPMAALSLDADRLIRITVCTRPFRPAGPRLEAETANDKLIVHNYGHGGSGWSLAWGCADEAAALALSAEPGPIAVIGAGVAGLTTGLRLAEAGADVVIYARDFPSQTRSARASGVWSPSSRIGLAPAVDDAFADRWERWTRASYAAHLRYVGLVGDPVEFIENYTLFNNDSPPGAPASRAFLRLSRRTRDLSPPSYEIDRAEHPFAADRARGGLMMTFNVARYATRLRSDFLAHGGRMIRRTFPDRAAIMALPNRIIVNCTGYDAKRLWGDETLAPVRGQINWLAAQPAARYGFYHNQVFVVSRRDGLVVQHTGPNDDWGYGDENETADRGEFEDALARVAPLFA